MIFTVIGSGTGVPSARRASPCHHLDAGGTSIVLDAGSGSVQRLLQAGIDIRDVDVLLLSHFHPDHVSDLVPWLFALRNPDFGRAGSLKIIGPVGLRRFLTSLEAVHGRWIKPPDLDLSLSECSNGSILFSDLEIRSAATVHTEASIAFKITGKGGTAVVYGGDCSFSEELVDFSSDSDLLVLESSFPDEQPREGHLTPSQAGEIAERSGSRLLLLTHFYPSADKVDMKSQARRTYSGDIIIAEDGLKITVPPQTHPSV